MKDLLRKGAKGVGNMGTSAIRAAVAGVMGEIIREIMEETGVTSIAKDKMMDVGVDIIKKMDLNPRDLQRDFIKNAIMMELKLK
ncbi:MAG: hypothetical protein ACXAE3_03185 [Candidatus Kariarchaeaceae archaeon]|jgi:hypothetical protein